MGQGGSRHDAPRIVARLRVARWQTIVSFVLLLGGCQVVPQRTFIADVNALAWEENATVEFYNGDTLTHRRLNIVVRSNENFRQDTLTLRIAVRSPDSIRYEEPFVLCIPHDTKAAALRHQTTIAYRSDVILSDTGIYRFSFTPTWPVCGIEAIGIHTTNN